jgi:class 3 adenylate cyclase
MGMIPIDINENQENLDFEIQPTEDTISFIESPSECCIGIIDICKSTMTAARLSNLQIGKYYGMFLNTMTRIVKSSGGIVVKNGGDSLLYYFQGKSSDDMSMFIRCLECNLSMIDARTIINTKMQQENLPLLNFRISADYGKVILATSSNSTYHDIFGSPVNFCSKINALALPNTAVIGGDIHQRVKTLQGYAFQEIKGYSVGFKQQYPVFSVVRNCNQHVASVELAIQKALFGIGKSTLNMVTYEVFKKHGCLISDCYENPMILKNILKDMFGDSHIDIINKINSNLGEYIQQKPIAEFLEKLKQ